MKETEDTIIDMKIRISSKFMRPIIVYVREHGGIVLIEPDPLNPEKPAEPDMFVARRKVRRSRSPDGKTAKVRIHEFLKEHPTTTFSNKTICRNLKMKGGTVSPALRDLANEGLVEKIGLGSWALKK